MSMSRNKLIFKAVYAMLGNPAREKVSIQTHHGTGNNQGLAIDIAQFKDCPKEGMTTLLSLGFNQFQDDEEANTGAEVYFEMIAAVRNDLSKEFAQTDFQYYAIAAGRNNWPSHYNYFGDLKSFYNTDCYAILSPCWWENLKSSFAIEKARIELLWYLPLLEAEKTELAALDEAQRSRLLLNAASQQKLLELNRQKSAFA